MARLDGINSADVTYQAKTVADTKPVDAVEAENKPQADKVQDETQNKPQIDDTENTVAQQNAKIKKAVDDINKKSSNSEAIFGIHEATNRVTIKIVDKTTKDVIKEFPPEKTLDMIAKVWEMAGLMVDEKR